MQFVQSTPIALALVALMVWLGTRRGLVVFLAVTPLGAMAAFNLPALGNTTITVSDLAVVTMFVMVALQMQGVTRLLGPLAPGQPGFALLLFLRYAVVATIFFPRIFAGMTEVFGVARIDGAVGVVMRPLRPDGGNLSQLMRFFISAMAFLALAAALRRSADTSVVVTAIQAATLVHVVLAVLDVVSFNTGMNWIMDPFRTANYTMATNQELAGVKRLAGGFPEASAFGYYSMGLFGFWLGYWFASGRDRKAGLFLALMTAVLLRTTSSSAYVAVAGLLIVLALGALLSRRSRLMTRQGQYAMIALVAVLPLALAGGIMAYEILPGVRAFLDRALFQKLSTDSGVERMSWNVQALRNFYDTGMLGAGLGSVRASNWLAASLATTGILGTLALGAYVLGILRLRPEGEPGRQALVQGLKVACLALLVRALVTKSSPNLDVIFFSLAGLAVAYARAPAPSPARAEFRQDVDEIATNPPDTGGLGPVGGRDRHAF